MTKNNFTAHHRKIALIIALGARQLAALSSRHKLLRLAITPTSHADWQACQRRFKSLATHSLKHHMREWMTVVEFQPAPAASPPFSIRFHLLVTARLSSMQQLSQWRDDCRDTLNRYGFRLIHACSADDAEATGCFLVAKYQTAVRAARDARLKGARLVRFSHGWRNAFPRFAWHSAGGWLWRAKLARFAQAIGARQYDDLAKLCGARWAYHLGNAIIAIELTDYPTMDHAIKDGWMPADEKEPDARPITIGGNPVPMKQSPNTPLKLPVQIVAQVALRNLKK